MCEIFFFLFDLILYVPSTIFSYKGTGLPGLNQYSARINVLAQGRVRNVFKIKQDSR